MQGIILSRNKRDTPNPPYACIAAHIYTYRTYSAYTGLPVVATLVTQSVTYFRARLAYDCRDDYLANS